MMTTDPDVVVIGAGHNGLVCAAYLACAGLRVYVAERWLTAGGCVTTAPFSHAPGFRADIGGLEQGAMSASPAIAELQLERYGLRYLHRDTGYFFPFPDGTSWTLERNVEHTVASIAAFSPTDSRAYRRFVELSHHILMLLNLSSDGPRVSLAGLSLLSGLGSLGNQSAHRLLRLFLTSPRVLLEEWFESEYVRAALANYAVHGQISPSQVGAGYLPMIATACHLGGGARPEGGGAALITALVRCIEEHGGAVVCGNGIRHVETRASRVVAVTLDDGQVIRARKAVVSAIDARRLFLDLLPPEAVPATLLHEVRQIRSGRDNCGEMSVACALDEEPRFARHQLSTSTLQGSILIAPSLQDVDGVFADIKCGILPKRPVLMSAIPSLLDPSLAPPGKHVLWIAAFVPYQLANGQSWDDVKEMMADRLIATFGQYAPNAPASVLDRIVVSPVDWERRTGNIRGNADHIDQTIDQMLLNRPSPSLSGYRTPIRGLYLTGAGTHPGGGITGTSGRNTARLILSDFKIRGSAIDPAALRRRADRLWQATRSFRALERLLP